MQWILVMTKSHLMILCFIIDTSEQGLSLWLLDRLDQKRHLQPNKAAANLDLTSCVKYRITSGLNLHVLHAYGLPGMFVCLARLEDIQSFV